MINPRSVAIQGVGVSPFALATQGFEFGIYVQLGGMGQVIGFGLPSVGVGGGAPLLIEVPSLATLIAYGMPSVGGGAARPDRLFVRMAVGIWSLLTRGVWRE